MPLVTVPVGSAARTNSRADSAAVRLLTEIEEAERQATKLTEIQRRQERNAREIAVRKITYILYICL